MPPELLAALRGADLQTLVLVLLGTASAVAGWWQARRQARVDAQKLALEAWESLAAAKDEELSDARISIRTLRETIEADEREDAQREHNHEECVEELKRERRAFQAYVEATEPFIAAEWAEEGRRLVGGGS